MPQYEYKCKVKKHPIITVVMGMNDNYTIKCPKCNKKMTKMISKCHGGVAGRGWLDREGARRDMHKYTLQNNDPYGYMRQSGEVDHMIDKLNRAGKVDDGGSEDLVFYKDKWVKRSERDAAENSDDVTYAVCKSCKKLTLSSEMNFSKCIRCDPVIEQQLSGEEKIVRNILGICDSDVDNLNSDK